VCVCVSVSVSLCVSVSVSVCLCVCVYVIRGTERVKLAAVHDLCLGVMEGECFSLLGTNGAGKTTSLSVLIGEQSSTSGQCFIGGRDVGGSGWGVLQDAGYCPQINATFEHLTGREVIRFYCKLRCVKAEVLEQYIQSWVDLMKMSLHADKPCMHYSGGNKRKLCVVIALIGRPKMIILDEPSAGMDPIARRVMWQVVNQTRGMNQLSSDSETLNEKKKSSSSKCSIVLTTHFMDEADHLGDRIGIMSKGQLACLGTSQTLKTQYGSGHDLQMKTERGVDVEAVIQLVKVLVPASEVIEQPSSQFVKIRLLGFGADVSELTTTTTTTTTTTNPLSAGVASGQLEILRQESGSVTPSHHRPVADLLELLEVLEREKSRIGLQMYSIGQATLEQIFLRIANAENDVSQESEVDSKPN